MGERDLRRWREVLKRREASRGMLVAFEGQDGFRQDDAAQAVQAVVEGEGAAVTTTKWTRRR